MLIRFVFALVPLGMLLVSCAHPDASSDELSASYAWLDTPVRVASGPKRPQSTLAHLRTGLPSVAAVRLASEQRQAILEREQTIGATSESHEEVLMSEKVDDARRVGYYVLSPTRYRRHSDCCRSCREEIRPKRPRVVETVGLPVVPRPPVPTRFFGEAR